MSGTGKTVLAQRLGVYAVESGGLFLQGKFDQTQVTPFSALAGAFSQYCRMLDEGQTTHTSKVALELKNALGGEVYSLAKVIPNLLQFLGLKPIESGSVQGCVDAQKRLRYLMCQFVDVISSFSKVPITLYIDDVQWADNESIEIIFQLLLRLGCPSGRRQFYFLACMRQEEFASDDQEDKASDPFCGMLSCARTFGMSTTTVKLACINEGTINTMISGLLCLSPRLTRPLSNIIYQKTQGNPLFVSQLLISLDNEGLLRLSLRRRRWEWDEEKISARQLPNDVVEFLVGTICKQPADVQSALRVLSCFGAKTQHRIVQTLEPKLDLPLIQPLEVAVAEGLLNKTNECYIFNHDKIQEAAYQMIKPEDRCLHHFKNGIVLAPHALRCKDDDNLLFAAADQVNLGGPAVIQDVKAGLMIANLNLVAARRAMEKSNYASAHLFLDHGISFLRKNHWRDHYGLSLRLFDLAATCAFAIGDIESLTILTQQIVKFGRTLEDILNSTYLLVCSLVASSRVKESITKGVTVLSQLGEEFPVDTSEDNFNQHLQEVKAMLCHVGDEQLLNYRAMADRTKIMVMKFLARLYSSFYLLLMLQSMRIATLKMIKLSLCHGMSPISPIAFTYYGGLLVARGNIKEGYRFVKMAFKMIDQMGSNEVSGQVIGMGTHILCFVEPVQATIDFYHKGHDAAMQSGDVYIALVSKLWHTNGLFWSSKVNLEAVKESYAHLRRLTKQYNQLTWLTNVSIAETSTLTLLGLEDEIDRSADLTGSHLFQFYCHFHNLYIFYLFGRYDQMILSAKEYVSLKTMVPFLLYIDSCQSFILGLASFWIYRALREPVWFDRGCCAKLEMKQWAEASEWNFKGKLHLLKAEENYSHGDFESASNCYEIAISTSKVHKFLNDEALACELAGYFFLEQGKEDTSFNYFMRAHEKYGEWGACAKSNDLFQFVQENIAGPDAFTAPASRNPPSHCC
ncbi:hypothetical protein ACHAWF_013710 [Thalassiosira exigua]